MKLKDILHIPKWIDGIKAPSISNNMSLTDDWDAQVDEILQIGLSKQLSFRGRMILLDQCKWHNNPQPNFFKPFLEGFPYNKNSGFWGNGGSILDKKSALEDLCWHATNLTSCRSTLNLKHTTGTQVWSLFHTIKNEQKPNMQVTRSLAKKRNPSPSQILQGNWFDR